MLSYDWELPIPKYSGVAGKIIERLGSLGIYTYQTGFPIRITSSSDNELMYSAFFEYPGEPDQTALSRAKTNRYGTAESTISTAPTEHFSEDNTFGRIGERAPHLLLRTADQQPGFRIAQGISIWQHGRRNASNSGRSFSTSSTTRNSTILTATSPTVRILDASFALKEPREIQLALKFYF